MSKFVPVAQRLRTFVRDRVRRDGAYYRRGVAAELARRLEKPTSWVSEYSDANPAPGKVRTADLDTAVAICDFFGVKLSDFTEAKAAPRPLRPALPPRSAQMARAIKLLEMMSEKGQRRSVEVLADLARVYPRVEVPTRTEQRAERTAEKVRRSRGTR